MASILNDFARAVAKHPDRTAIVDGTGREVSFAQLQMRADGLARTWHAQGIRKGDRVLLAMGLNADLYASLAALWSLGGTVVLPEPAMGLAGLKHAARVSNATAFCSGGFYGLLKWVLPDLWKMRHLRPNTLAGPDLNLAPPGEDEIALISFTSGTSGAPKAIPRSHGFLTAQHQAIAPLLHSDTPQRDLVAFPVFVLINIASGQTSVLPNWKMSRLTTLGPAQIGKWLESQNVSRVLIPPSLCEKLGDTTIPASLHTVFTGGGPVFPDILDKLVAAKNELKIICVYGSTEAEPIAHLDATEISVEHRTAMLAGHGLFVGRPVDEIQVRIVADEIQVAGAHVNGGYLDPAHNRENKILDGDTIWHRTGDAGYFDDQGQLWLLGRSGSQVFVDGKPVFPFSIEVATRQWDGVSQCAVLELDDETYLMIEGDIKQMPTWNKRAVELKIHRIKHVPNIPMDKRHGSKIDRAALKKLFKP